MAHNKKQATKLTVIKIFNESGEKANKVIRESLRLYVKNNKLY